MEEEKISLTGRVARFLERYGEAITLVLLVAWCLLPIVVACYDVYIAVNDEIPFMTDAEVHSKTFYYVQSVDFFFARFRELGTVTLVYAVLTILLANQRILSLKSLKEQPWMYLMLALLAWAVVCTNMANDTTRAFYGDGYLNDGLLSYYMYAGVFTCASMVRKERTRRIVTSLFCVVILVMATIVFLQEAGVDQLDFAFPSGRAAVFNQFNHFGYLLAMTVASLAGLYLNDDKANGFVRALYLVGVLYVTYVLLINDTFGAYLASGFAMIMLPLYYRLRGNKLRATSFLPLVGFVLVSAISIFGLPAASATSRVMAGSVVPVQALAEETVEVQAEEAAPEAAEAAPEAAPAAEAEAAPEEQTSLITKTPNTRLDNNFETFSNDIHNILEGNEEANHAGSTRFLLWKDTIERIKAHPIFGVGPMGLIGDDAIANGDAPHNEFLTVAAYLGIPGLIMYVGALVTLAVNKIRNLKNLSPMVVVAVGMVTAYLASSCFGNPVFNTVPYFWLFLGLATGTNEDTLPLVYAGTQEQDTKEATE